MLTEKGEEEFGITGEFMPHHFDAGTAGAMPPMIALKRRGHSCPRHQPAGDYFFARSRI